MKAFGTLLLASIFLLATNTIYAEEKSCSRVVAQLLTNHKGASFKPINSAPVRSLETGDNGLIPGDWVVFIKNARKNPEVLRLITNQEKLIARVQKDERGRLFLAIMNFGKKARLELPHNTKMNLPEGSFLRINIKKSDVNDGSKPYVYVEEVLGKSELTEDLLHEHHISQYAVSTKHSKVAQQHSNELRHLSKSTKEILEQELVKGRRDLRSLPLRSIDNITTIDYDDMIYVESHTKGHTLYVAISDVAHWIDKDSPLAHEASKKNLTAYFDHTRYPLYPEDFERHLSLMPKEDRLALVVKIDFDKAGNRIDYEVFEALVNNQKAWNYEEVNPLWEQFKKGEKTPFDRDFKLYELLHQRRKNAGASYFGRKGSDFNIEAQNLLRYSKQEESHELIAEFMIEANEVVGDFMKKNNLPGVYRAHDVLEEEHLELIKNLAITMGIPNIKPHTTLSEILQRTKDPIQHEILIAYVLRYTPPAYYTTAVDGHSTLASRTYMQFTSPIRRDTDTLNHRIIKAFLEGEQIPYNIVELQEKADYATAKIISEKRRERLVRQAQKMSKLNQTGKKVFMARTYYVGKDFVNLRIEDFDLDITLNVKELAKKGIRFDEKSLSMISKNGKITLGTQTKVKLEKWDSFTGEATFSPIFD